MGIDSVADGHGFGLAITGMSVVFAGLVLVTLFIAALPRLLDWAGRNPRPAPRLPRLRPRTTTAPAGGRRGEHRGTARADADGLDPVTLAAIGFVIHAEHERALLSDEQRITLRDDDEEQRVWTAIGKMRTLATRM